jgi:hypothetical protein
VSLIPLILCVQLSAQIQIFDISDMKFFTTFQNVECALADGAPKATAQEDSWTEVSTAYVLIADSSRSMIDTDGNQTYSSPEMSCNDYGFAYESHPVQMIDDHLFRDIWLRMRSLDGSALTSYHSGGEKRAASENKVSTKGRIVSFMGITRYTKSEKRVIRSSTVMRTNVNYSLAQIGRGMAADKWFGLYLHSPNDSLLKSEKPEPNWVRLTPSQIQTILSTNHFQIVDQVNSESHSLELR